jgi:hypothetical protein
MNDEMIAPPPPLPPPKTARLLRWHRLILGWCFVLFAIELGFVLLWFPWWDGHWEMHWVALQGPEWREFWMNRYFRGLMSGLGLLNLWVGFGEMVKLLRGS